MTLYPDRTEYGGSARTRWVTLCLLTVLLAWPMIAGAGTATFVPDWYMVIDRAAALDDGQEQSAINDAWRLNMDSIPTQVVTEFAGLTQEQANQRAQELRTNHAIESSPGADDGILVYLAVDANNRESRTLAVSVGSHTLPLNGLTMDTLQAAFREVMTPQLGVGQPARAIVYGLRQLIYLEQFEPPALTPLDSGMKKLSSILAVLAPLALLISAGTWIASACAKPTAHRWLLALGMSALAPGLAIISVPARSSIGVWCALAIGVLALWRLIRLDDAQPVPGRRITVTPRRSFVPRRSQRTGNAL